MIPEPIVFWSLILLAWISYIPWSKAARRTRLAISGVLLTGAVFVWVLHLLGIYA